MRRTAAAGLGGGFGAVIGMKAAAPLTSALTRRLPITRWGLDANGESIRGVGAAIARYPGRALNTGLSNVITSPLASTLANGVVYGRFIPPQLDDFVGAFLGGAGRANTISPFNPVVAQAIIDPLGTLGRVHAAAAAGTPINPAAFSESHPFVPPGRSPAAGTVATAPPAGTAAGAPGLTAAAPGTTTTPTPGTTTPTPGTTAAPTAAEPAGTAPRPAGAAAPAAPDTRPPTAARPDTPMPAAAPSTADSGPAATSQPHRAAGPMPLHRPHRRVTPRTPAGRRLHRPRSRRTRGHRPHRQPHRTREHRPQHPHRPGPTPEPRPPARHRRVRRTLGPPLSRTPPNRPRTLGR